MNLNIKPRFGRKASLALVLAVSAAAAQAALPTEAAAAFTGISDNVTDILAVVWPIVATMTGGFVLIKLFKKGANKAT